MAASVLIHSRGSSPSRAVKIRQPRVLPTPQLHGSDAASHQHCMIAAGHQPEDVGTLRDSRFHHDWVSSCVQSKRANAG